MLFEEFLIACEEQLEGFLASKLPPSALFEELKRLARYIDPEEFKSFPSLKEYLTPFLHYYSVFQNLPPERQRKRAENGFKMIQKMRKLFLLTRKEEIENLKFDRINSEASVKFARGVGEARAKLLQRFGIEKVRDLLWWLPRDYEDRRKIIPLSSIRPGEKVTLLAELLNYSIKRVKDYVIVTAVISDGFGQMLLKWFNQEYITKYLKKGARYLITGVPKKNPFGPYEMNSPEFEEISGEPKREILPIYSLTSGLTQKMMRRIIRKNLAVLKVFEEFIPQTFLEKRDLLPREHAMLAVHFPKSLYEVKKARERLSYEELFLFEVALLHNKEKLKHKNLGLSKRIAGELSRRFIEALPFKPTEDQLKAFNEIRDDLKSPMPMNRMLQGDVGSGKTLVAELAIIDNFEAGYQSAMMVPTSVLAIQQYDKLREDLSKIGIKVGLLVGSMKKSEQEAVKRALTLGEIDVIVGTHALIQENVNFKDLGLVIVDEQHRFGVRQREALMNKGNLVDTLVMTATPIPRTLALTAYGDLDISTIREMPPGRSPVRTLIITENRLPELYSFIRDEVAMGHQVFFIYPLIEESEIMDLKAATEAAEFLGKEVFPDIGVELLHGKMSDQEKSGIMERFKNKETMILVSTSVIEVGIDIPTATVMVIEHPERFGLAQLHQLRGRVGRSALKSYCILVLNRGLSSEATERLRKFASTSDGFKVAEIDLRLRGPGEFMGTRQHGLPDFKVADIVRDSKLLFCAREDATELIETDPELKQHPGIKKEILERFGEKISLIEVG
ncbi:ATP-dependent DNA helicase RecG [Kosmotoga pacifica]|uniref:ATP-dependent DNA helicase RecG n=1 Tax=Kosmotoga pacifica TaxID=1330330 RepID=A0A0G2Z4E9_9BACT|nr:ATP-dependent DNA helicase RecG [Kosmotoga pacifica]AKI96480.1 helicase [Kosmotoga pacifica]